MSSLANCGGEALMKEKEPILCIMSLTTAEVDYLSGTNNYNLTRDFIVNKHSAIPDTLLTR